MGASVSSNVVNAVSKVASQVQTDTTASSSQTASCVSKIKLNRCVVKGNLDVNSSCNVMETSNNILTQIAQNNLNSSISQKLAQEAASTVGTLGIGFADANNTANVFASSYDSIVNSVSSSALQNANSIFDFECRNGTIYGDVKLGVSSDQNFLSDQILKNDAVNKVVQNISQDVSQKATATVSGIAGFIIALAILLAAIGWVLFKPLEIAMSNKFLIITIIILAIVGIAVLMFLYSLPPFFNKPTTCISAQAIVGGCSGDSQCVSPSTQTIRILKPPMRYAFNIIGQGDTTVDPGNSFVPGMLQMAIAYRGGWTQNTYNHFASDPKFAGLPNPLLQQGATYITNVEKWQPYINDDHNAANARFILATDLQMDTYSRMFDYEKCSVNGQVYSDTTCYKFVPDVMPPDLQLAVANGGTITGQFGSCNTPNYRLQKYFRIGGISLLVILLIVFVIVILKSTGKKSKNMTSDK